MSIACVSEIRFSHILNEIYNNFFASNPQWLCEYNTHFDNSENVKTTRGISTQVDLDLTTIWLVETRRAPIKQSKLLSVTLRRFYFI